MSPRVILLAASLLAVALVPAPAAGASTFTTTVESFDGHNVPITVYLSETGEASPTLLWGHGWAGSKADSAGKGNFFAAAGYNVVAMDFRGHGEARGTSAARVHDVDFEIKDVIAVIDWIALQNWAQLESTGDPVLGALGGSYGGGYQLLTAAFDDRLDAIAPEITWNDLPQSLAPNKAIKSGWVDLLYAGGHARADLDPIIDQAFVYGMATNQLPDGSVPGVPDLVSQFTRSSPKSYPNDITIPTLLIQGIPDTLFNLNEAVGNARQIAAAQTAAGLDVDVTVFTHLGGHILSTGGLIPVPIPDTGFQPAGQPGPCGSENAAILSFYDARLKNGNAADAVPDLSVALESGGCLTFDDGFDFADHFPARAISVSSITVPGAVSSSARLMGTPLAPPVVTDLLVATAPVTIAGIPTLDATITSTSPDATIYFSIVTIAADGTTKIVDAQVMPLRIAGPVVQQPISIDLGGIATTIPAGGAFGLQISTIDAQYAHNFGRTPAPIVLEDVTVGLPVL